MFGLVVGSIHESNKKKDQLIFIESPFQDFILDETLMYYISEDIKEHINNKSIYSLTFGSNLILEMSNSAEQKILAKKIIKYIIKRKVHYEYVKDLCNRFHKKMDNKFLKNI